MDGLRRTSEQITSSGLNSRLEQYTLGAERRSAVRKSVWVGFPFAPAPHKHTQTCTNPNTSSDYMFVYIHTSIAVHRISIDSTVAGAFLVKTDLCPLT